MVFLKKNERILTIFLLFLFLICNQILSKEEHKDYSDISIVPFLPRPIGKEAVLITSAGQGIESYIIKDMANKLMIHNIFMPRSLPENLEDINTVIIAVGFSSIENDFSKDYSYQDEYERIQHILKKSKNKNIKIISIYCSDKLFRGKANDNLIKLVCEKSDYIITTKNSDSDGFISKIAKEEGISLTLVDDVSEMYEPLASIFR